MATLFPDPAWVERWWRGEAGAAGAVLDMATAPAEALYRAAVALRGAWYDRRRTAAQRVDVPVISVGNLAVGGTGKTPVARWLCEECARRGARPGVLHRGYGGGDEAALHRAWGAAAVVVEDRDRVAAARRAIAAGATVLVLDDGFQHRRLARDVDLVLVAAESLSERPRLLPRGPWREPPAALRRATAVAVTRRVATPEAAAAVQEAVRRIHPDAPVFGLRLEPKGWSLLGATRGGGNAARPGEALPGAAAGSEGAGAAAVAGRTCAGRGPQGDVVAVAGIARPDWFVENARAAGARVVALLPFPDHHRYGAGDLRRIREAAAGRPIVTTAKDAIKLGELAHTNEVWVLEQTVIPEDGAGAFGRILDELLA